MSDLLTRLDLALSLAAKVQGMLELGGPVKPAEVHARLLCDELTQIKLEVQGAKVVTSTAIRESQRPIWNEIEGYWAESRSESKPPDQPCENIDGQCGASWCDCDYQRRLRAQINLVTSACDICGRSHGDRVPCQEAKG